MIYDLSTILQIALGINIGLSQDGYLRNLFLGKYIKNKDIIESIDKKAENIENLLIVTEKKGIKIDEHKFKFIAINNDFNELKNNENEQQIKFIPKIVESNKNAINYTIIFILSLIIWGSLENTFLKNIESSNLNYIILGFFIFSLFIFSFNIYSFFIKLNLSLYLFFLFFIFILLKIDEISSKIIILKIFIIFNSLLPYLCIIKKIINNREQAKYEYKKINTILEKFHVDTRNSILNDFLT